MKECPRCKQSYRNDDLRFCRFDGSSLVSKTTPSQEAATLRLPSGHLNNRFTPLEELRRRSESGKLS